MAISRKDDGFFVNKREGLPEKGDYRKFSISLSEETEYQLDDLQRTIWNSNPARQ